QDRRAGGTRHPLAPAPPEHPARAAPRRAPRLARAPLTDRFTARQRRHWERKRRFLDPREPAPEAFVRPKLAWALRHVPVDGSTSVLDVGAGDGTFTWQWMARAGRVVGVDFSANLLGRSPCPERMVQADASRLPFRDEQFDVVAEGNFLHHTGDPLAVLREMARVARRHLVLV